MNKIFAPWTPEQVENLNRYQHAGVGHPFTCPYGDENREVVLVATDRGWVCPSTHCGYVQDWAWEFMARPENSQ